MTGLDRIHAIDADAGTVLCDAGVSLHRLMEVLLPLGWFVPVTPGTRYVTVGGAVGADIHGKNHHVSGSFSRHVASFELLTADGRVRTVVPGTPLFEATAGGMGLTGVILTATVRLQPVRTSWMSVDTERASDLDDLMARLADTDHRYRYSVAWIDLLARGRATGRAVLTRGDHAPLDALPRSARARRDPLSFRTSRLPTAPPPSCRRGCSAGRPWGCSTSCGTARRPAPGPGSSSGSPPSSTRWTACRTGTACTGGAASCSTSSSSGTAGEDTLRRIVRRISERRCPSFLAVLKRFGDADPGWLSFPVPGWTLALDIPRRCPASAPSSTSSTKRSSAPAAASTSPRTPGCAPSCSPPCTPGWTTSVPCAPSWTRAGCSPRTCPAACACDPLPDPAP